MLKKESNQLVAITNISESLNIQRDTRQHSEQTKVSVPLNKPLGLTHVTTTVSNIDVCYMVTSFVNSAISKSCHSNDFKI